MGFAEAAELLEVALDAPEAPLDAPEVPVDAPQVLLVAPEHGEDLVQNRDDRVGELRVPSRVVVDPLEQLPLFHGLDCRTRCRTEVRPEQRFRYVSVKIPRTAGGLI
jgi:hypothetical protein